VGILVYLRCEDRNLHRHRPVNCCAYMGANFRWTTTPRRTEVLLKGQECTVLRHAGVGNEIGSPSHRSCNSFVISE